MWDFERDSVGKGGVLFFLALNVLCLLWCVHRLLLLRGAAFLLGLLILLLWIAFVMADEAKALLYHRQMVFLRPEGVFVGSRKHSRKLAWEEIREAEVRFARSSGWNLFANDWLVLSKEPLSDSVRGAICSDVSPWLPEMGLAEFRFSALSWDPDIGNEEDVAEKLGVTRQSVAKWESGDSVPDLDKCKQLADVFGVSLDDLANYEPDENMGFAVPPKGKHLFGLVTVGEKGQVVIPAKARKIFEISAGDQLVVLGDGSQVFNGQL